MPPRTQEERDLQRRLRKQLMAQGIDPDTVPEAALMSLDPGVTAEDEGPLLESGTEVDVEVGQAMFDVGPPAEEPLEAMGAPGPTAMSEIAGAQAQEAALPAPMTEQEGMAPPEAEVVQDQLPSPDELPDIPAEDPIDEELAQRAGQIESQTGGAVRAANQGLAGALRGGLGKLLAPGAKDPEKLALSQEKMAEADVLEGQRDEARLQLDEEREQLQVARTATIEARSRAEMEKSLRLQEDVDQRERFEQDAKTKSEESTATVREEYEKFKAMKIDPDRAMNEMSTGRKISFVLLGLLGGIFEAAAADAGQQQTGPSVADTIIRRIDTIIKRDISAQKSAIGQQRDVLGQAFNMDASVNKSIRDQGARLEASQALRWNALVGKLDAEIEKTDEPAKIAALGEVKAEAEQREKNAWAQTERLEGKAYLKESQFSQLDIQTAQAERNFRAGRADAAANRALRREDMAARRQDRKASLELRRQEAGRKGRREEGVQERFETRQGVKFEEKTAVDAAQMKRYRRAVEGFSGPDAPTAIERGAIKMVKGALVYPLGMSDKSQKIYREFEDTKLRLIKEITGVAGRAQEMERIESVLGSPLSTAAQITDAIESAIEIIDYKQRRKKVAYGKGITEKFEDVDAETAETPAQEFKRKSRERGKKGKSDRPPLRAR